MVAVGAVAVEGSAVGRGGGGSSGSDGGSSVVWRPLEVAGPVGWGLPSTDAEGAVVGGRWQRAGTDDVEGSGVSVSAAENHGLALACL